MTRVFACWHHGRLPEFPNTPTAPARPKPEPPAPELPNWVRRCPECGLVKPTEEFRLQRNGTHGDKCAECVFGGTR